MPFGFDKEYKDFDACVADNSDKDDPNAYCGWLKNETEKRSDVSRAVKRLLTLKSEWKWASDSARNDIVKRSATIVDRLVRRGETWSPNRDLFARKVFRELRKNTALAMPGATDYPVLVPGYIYSSKGMPVVRDINNDVSDDWHDVVKSFVSPVYYDCDSYKSDGMPLYDLVLIDGKSGKNKRYNRRRNISKSAFQCYDCGVKPSVEYIARRANGQLLRRLGCYRHFQKAERLYKYGIVSRRRAIKSQLSKPWFGKDAMTTGDLGGPGQAPATIEQKKPRKKDIAPIFKGGHSGFIVLAPISPDMAEELAVPGGEPLSDLHITLAYFGPASELSDDEKGQIEEAVADVVAMYEPIKARVGGIARFLTRDNQHPVVALVDAPELNVMRDELVFRLADEGIEPYNDYAYIPHITLTYEADESLQENRISSGLEVTEPQWPTELDDFVVPELEFFIDELRVVDASDYSAYPLGDYGDMPVEEKKRRSGRTRRSRGNTRGNKRNKSVRSNRRALPASKNFPVLTLKADFKGPNRIYKADNEERYTFTVVYKPDDVDAHGEYTTPDDLQKALWQHVKDGDRNVYVQHGRLPGVGFRKAGEWVELSTWPYKTEVEFLTIDGKTHKRSVPAGSAWMGTIWEPWAWELVKSGDIRGLSFGGTSRRVSPR